MIEPLEIVLLAVSLAVSLALGVWLLLSRTLQNRPLLAYEPRRPVPWNAVAGCLLASLLLLGSVVNYASTPSSIASRLEGEAGMSADEYIEASCFGGLVSLTLVVMLAASIVAGGTVSISDFGLPTDWRTAVRDVRIGATAMGVGFGPVILLQLVTAFFFGSASTNPTLLMLQESTSVAVFLSAFFAAVIVAPIFEEFVCRLLFQGWMEKAEARIHASGESDADAEHNGPRLGERAISIGLTPGLAPILISSLVFSLLHLNAGPDWIALFPFALVQGYLYQRTHQILPCIVHHMLFNTVGVTLTFWAL